MLKEFMGEKAVIVALSQPVNFSDRQIAFVADALNKKPNVRWNFLFLHEPAWGNPSPSFKAIPALLKNRKHTFFAGHLHDMGVTMTDKGPTFASGAPHRTWWAAVREAGPAGTGPARPRPIPIPGRRLC